MENTNAESAYIDSIKLADWKTMLNGLVSQMSSLKTNVIKQRKLRYAEIDVEAERLEGKLAPDEMYIPQHIIDSNIRREQPNYVQYVTASNRAVVLTPKDDPRLNGTALEKDFTNRLRFPGWQAPMYANIDAMQQNGWSAMEVVFEGDQLEYRHIPIGDLGIAGDSKKLQTCELVVKAEHFSRTELKNLVTKFDFDAVEMKKLLDTKPENDSDTTEEKSLFKLLKLMFRVNGVVHVAWVHKDSSDKWLRVPKKLFLGRKSLDGSEVFETDYPYFLFAYTISEDDSLLSSRGRVFLDQDVQNAVSSLMSSFCTAHRRGSGLYFSVDSDDPNADAAMQKNVFFKTGALINKRIKQFQLNVPDAGMLNATQSLVTMNMQETSGVNFAAMNRKDSQKTATEISAATNSAQMLSTVQVVLFSSALRSMYELMFGIVTSRVLVGLIKVLPEIGMLYQASWYVKPSGDVDVVERQQTVTAMLNAWPVMQNTPAAQVFLGDLIRAMFPETADKYIAVLEQAVQAQAQQAQSAAAQQQAVGMQMAQSIIELSQHPDMFSDKGQLHVLPKLMQSAKQLQGMMAASQNQGVPA